MRLLGIIAGFTALLSAGQVHAEVRQLPLPTSCTGVSALRFPGTVASGWSVMKIAGGLRGVRTVIWDANGNMLVSEAGKGISVHTFGDNGCINSTSTLISNVQLNHGLALTPDSKTLYASGERSVWSWTYDPATRTVSNQKTAVTGMDSGIHSTRNVIVVKQQPNLILVQVGSNANLDMQSAQPATGRAIIKVFDMTNAPAAGHNYKTAGEVFAYGLRNEIGFVQDPAGIVWGVENSGDDFRLNNQDIHQDNPAEKLNNPLNITLKSEISSGRPPDVPRRVVRVPDVLQRVESDALHEQGAEDGGPVHASGGQRGVERRRLRDQGEGAAADVHGAHAPIWNAFDANATNMYVTFHGSWDRQPPTGFKVVEVPFTKTADGAYDPVAPADSMTGYKDIFSAPNPGGCTANGLTNSNCIRLTAAGWDPSGRGLFVGSDNAAEGEIYILSKK